MLLAYCCFHSDRITATEHGRINHAHTQCTIIQFKPDIHYSHAEMTAHCDHTATSQRRHRHAKIASLKSSHYIIMRLECTSQTLELLTFKNRYIADGLYDLLVPFSSQHMHRRLAEMLQFIYNFNIIIIVYVDLFDHLLPLKMMFLGSR